MSKPWLGIDTTTDVASLALGTWEACAADRSVGARQHAAQIVPLIKRVLGETPLQAPAGIVVGDGPGSFTGVRIAWSAAKGLAHEHELPILAVPSLHAAAYAAARGTAGPIVACFDALRGQVYGAIYAFPNGRLETLVAPGLFTMPELERVAPAVPVQAVGDGAVRYAREIEAWIGRPPTVEEWPASLAPALIALAPLVGYPATAEPIYGRPAEAQVKWEARHGRTLPNSLS